LEKIGKIKQKIAQIPTSSWVRACDISPDNMRICSGGLDQELTLHRRGLQNILACKIHSHVENYISDVKFLDTNKVLATSGDGKLTLHDLQAQEAVLVFQAQEDLLSVSVCPDNSFLVATGGVDATVRVFDLRLAPEHKACFELSGHTGDVNSVDWRGNSIASGSDDATVKVWDCRAKSCVASLNTASLVPVGSCRLSLDESVCFSAHSYYWTTFDVLTGTAVCHDSTSHTNNVSSLALSCDGRALLTGSWDSTIGVHRAASSRH